MISRMGEPTFAHPIGVADQIGEEAARTKPPSASSSRSPFACQRSSSLVVGAPGGFVTAATVFALFATLVQ